MHRYRLTDTQTNRWKQKPKKIQNCCQCWSTRYLVSVLSTRCGWRHPKGLIVASYCKIKIIIIIKNFNQKSNKNSTFITFICQCQVSFQSQKKTQKTRKTILVDKQNFTINLITELLTYVVSGPQRMTQWAKALQFNQKVLFKTHQAFCQSQ